MRWWVLALGLLAGGCEGEEDELEIPECEPGELAVFGTVEGQSINTRVTVGELDISNDPPTVTVRDSQGAPLLELTLDAPLAAGGTASATAVLDLTSLDDPRVGSCANDGPLSEVTRSGDGITFRLRSVRPEPYCGTSEPAELTGCARQ